MHARFFAALLLFASSCLWSQEAASPRPVTQTLEHADTQRQHAERLRKDADKRYADEQAACYSKFLVNSCLSDAKKRHTATMVEARQLELSAREFQREATRSDVEAEKSRREAERPARESEQQEQAERYRAEEAAKATGRAEMQRDKERKVTENRNKLAEEHARRQAREEQRARKNAEKMAKKAKERAKAAEKAAARATRE